MNTSTQNNCKKCNSSKTILVEYDMIHPEHYDGFSEVECMECGARFGRWSGRELASGEYEIKRRIQKN